MSTCPGWPLRFPVRWTSPSIHLTDTFASSKSEAVSTISLGHTYPHCQHPDLLIMIILKISILVITNLIILLLVIILLIIIIFYIIIIRVLINLNIIILFIIFVPITIIVITIVPNKIILIIRFHRYLNWFAFQIFTTRTQCCVPQSCSTLPQKQESRGESSNIMFISGTILLANMLFS